MCSHLGSLDKYLFKAGLGSHYYVIVFIIQFCLFIPGTSKIVYNQLAELVTVLYIVNDIGLRLKWVIS